MRFYSSLLCWELEPCFLLHCFLAGVGWSQCVTSFPFFILKNNVDSTKTTFWALISLCRTQSFSFSFPELKIWTISSSLFLIHTPDTIVFWGFQKCFQEEVCVNKWPPTPTTPVLLFNCHEFTGSGLVLGLWDTVTGIFLHFLTFYTQICWPLTRK